jgi:hypothetical protein
LPEQLQEHAADLGGLVGAIPSAVMARRCDESSRRIRRPSEALRSEIAATLRAVTKLQGSVDLVAPASLPKDGKVISDERNVDRA